MKYGKIKDGVLFQTQPNEEEGFIQVPDDAVCGQIWNGESFENPPPSSSQLAAHLTSYRKSRETGGFEIMGMTIPSDEKTERRIIGARVKVQADPDYTIQDWTTDGGKTSVTLTAQMIIAISDAFDEHIQKCFSAEVAVKLNLPNYTTTAEVEAAFETAYQDDTKGTM